MGRTAVLIRRLAAIALAVAAWAASNAGGPLKIVKVGDAPRASAWADHVRFAAEQGFDAVWVYSGSAAEWWPPERPVRWSPQFRELVRLAHDHRLRVVVSINPVSDSFQEFRFSDRAHVRRVREVVRTLARDFGVREFVLSFDDQPIVLEELQDALRFGRSAAAAHLDLTRRVARWVPRGSRLWLCASAYADVHLGDGTGPYSAVLLAGLPSLPRDVGVVWTGPDVVSPSIGVSDVVRVKERFGGRPLMLYDNYPVNEDGLGRGLALVLGPLRQRDPEILRFISAYLACPMTQLGASQLPLRTIADFLRDPEGYDPDASWSSAQRALAGSDSAARDALRVQSLEWGGFVGDRNYRPAWIDSIDDAAARVDEPAYVASWKWVAARYPQRMSDLEHLPPGAFRHDLLTAMARRLAVARAMPVVAELRARNAAGRSDVQELLDDLSRQAALWDDVPAARRALLDFLEAVDVPGFAGPDGPRP